MGAQEGSEFSTSLLPDSDVNVLQLIRDKVPAGHSEAFFPKILMTGQRCGLPDSGVGHSFEFDDMVALAVMCDGQVDFDRYWEGLISGGGEPAHYRWLKGRFGIYSRAAPPHRAATQCGPDAGLRAHALHVRAGGD
jgi:predicted 3-demethylubiquinone-9 3-methyltransferase (glyoxalase superfamily)